MELNDVLLWLVGASCLALIVTSLRAGPRDMLGWLLAAGVILTAGTIAFHFAPKRAGYVALAIWAVLVGVPTILNRRLQTQLRRQRYDRAAALARIVRLFHPGDGWWHWPTLFYAQHLGLQGDRAGALALLEPLAARQDSIGRVATHHLLRVARRWEDLVRWFDQPDVSHGFEVVREPAAAAPERPRSALPQPIHPGVAALLRRDPMLLATYLRALGEMGDLTQMIWAFERYRQFVESPIYTGPRNMVRLHMLSFGGQPQAVQSLLDGPLRDLPPGTRALWLATAEMAAGDVDAGRARLSAGLAGASPPEREAIEHRLAQPPADARPLFMVGGQELLDQLDLDREHDEQYSGFSSRARWPIVTHALILACVIVYGFEVRNGGGMTEGTLLRMGAAETTRVMHFHQYWRLLAANFLHYGAVHLAMNMLGLLALGPFVERTLGPWLYLPIYLLSGVFGIAGTIWLASRHPGQQALLVGASASIMGLVGATGAILLAGWWRDRARVAGQRLRVILLIVALQVLFDAFTPMVSGSAHLIGMLGGFVLTLPIRVSGRRVREGAK